MSRRTAEQTEGVSLVPFLAVLLCTMGSLIVLLIVIARQARLQAAHEQQAPPVRQSQTQSDSLELLAARVAQLRTARDTAADQLQGRRTELGYLEQHRRQIEDKLIEMRAAIDERKRLSGANAQQVSAAQAELKRLQATAVEVKLELHRLRGESATRKANYSIVPYDGQNGTRRRPFYIECRKDEIVLQPEGIVLSTEEDFAVPADPGNPLAAALRAAKEQLDLNGRQAEGEPYPLLLIRPDGAITYFIARQALQSWNEEFGYELIEADWKLSFPPADPVVAQAQHRAVEEARLRQRALLASMERRLAKRQQFRAAPGGGVMRDNGTIVGGGEPEEESGISGVGPHRGGPGKAAGRAAQGPGGAGPSTPGGPQDASAPRRQTDNSPSTRKSSDPNADQKWIPPHERPETEGPRGDSPVGAPGAEEKQTREGAGSVQPSAQTENLAKTRGRDWGLRNPERASIAVTRPISVICSADRLVVVPDDGPLRAIELAPRTRDSIDDFVGEVWQQMRSWGTAGKGMHWRPTLSVRVQPGGELRFDDLCALLDGSGLDVKRRGSASGSQPLNQRAARSAQGATR
ncbi:MAG: hypothetical protein WD176_05485 [Pirellulales bacterium]